MRIQTFSIIVGSSACDAHCPFCVSRMTPNQEKKKCQEINWRNFKIASLLAEKAGVTTVMLTGKGEPTLYPWQIEQYLAEVGQKFPLIELQTNGKQIVKALNKPSYHSTIVSESQLYGWYRTGLTTISISVVHWSAKRNAEIYCAKEGELHFDLPNLVEGLHKIGFSVRLSCVMVKGYVDGYMSAREFVNNAKGMSVDQITFVPVSTPNNCVDAEVFDWTREHAVSTDGLSSIKEWLDRQGDLLMELAHGALVYDIEGQNVCLSNCLKNETVQDKTLMRNLIFHPDGHLRYDWSHEGSIIL